MRESLVKDLLAVVWQYRLRLLRACLLVLLSNSLLILNPLLIREAVLALDPYSKNDPESFSFFLSSNMGSFYHSLVVWGVFLFTITLFSAYFKYRMRIAFIWVSRDVEYHLQNTLFNKIQSQTPNFFDKYRIGELLSRLTNDLSSYREVLGPGIMYPLHFLTMIFPAMTALFWIAPQLALLSCIPILVLPVLVLAIEGRAYKISLNVQRALGEMSTMAHETFSGIRIIKGYAVEDISLNKFTEACKKFISLNFRMATLEGMFYPFMTLITRLVTLLLVVFTSYLVIKAHSELSVADFISFMLIQSFIFAPILMLGWALPIYERGKAAYDRLLEIYQAPIEVSQAKKSISEISTGNISFNQLSFNYPQHVTQILAHLSFEIPEGSFFGIAGPIGAGKSTILNLLNRDYEVLNGTIAIGGKDIHNYSKKALQKLIATVEQTPFLFSRTISENIAFEKPDATQEEIEEASKLADLHDSVMSFPLQYQTIVGEKGVMLSGGQKQRVAIARAILTDRPIFLFDDIFSAIDVGTERKIFSALREKLKGKTVIMISHRTSVLNQMDYIIYMHDGKIIEKGTPSELKNKEGAYAALAELQRESKESTGGDA